MPEKLSSHQARLMLVLLGLIAYAPVLKVGFLWDDHVLIEDNPYLHGWTRENLSHDIVSTVSNGKGDEGFLRPVLTWSNRIDYSLWKLRPFGYHLTSLAIHLANAVLLYELILLLGLTPMTALLAGSLFAVHPIDVEGLLCVTGRATFLSFFFGMLTLIFFAEPAPSRYALGLVSFALALLSKEESVILPFLVPLIWTVQRTTRKPYSMLIPMFGVLGIYLAYRRYLFGALGAPADPLYAARFMVQAFPRILTHYVRLILVPWNLYSHRLLPHLSHIWFLSLAGWVLIILWSWHRRQNHPLAFFSIFWLVISLLPPALLMVYGGFMLDHWGYWAAPAILLPLGHFFSQCWDRQEKPFYKGMALLYFILLISYALLTRLNIELRNTDEKMFRWALHFTTSHPIEYNLGILLLQTDRAREAIPYFTDVKEAYPENLNNLHALALAYWHTGHPKLAKMMLEDLVAKHPAFQPARDSLRTISVRQK
jgi:hypothetical protein